MFSVWKLEGDETKEQKDQNLRALYFMQNSVFIL